jgi:hypothetical protein
MGFTLILCGQHQRPNLFQDFPKFRLRGKANGSISIQEGQPDIFLTFRGIFSFRDSRNSPENAGLSTPTSASIPARDAKGAVVAGERAPCR